MNPAAEIVYFIIDALTLAIFVRIVLSWFMVNPTSGFVVSIYQFFYQITEPILGPLRRIVPTIGMFDISPIVAIIGLRIIGAVLIEALA